MPNYPNNEVEREVRSRVNGAMEELIRKRNSELRELAVSKYAPGPGMGSGPYEQMRVRASTNFYEALFQQIVDSWVDVLTRESGRLSASDVSHVVQELEARASVAPMHIRRALASRGATAHLLPPGAMKALEDGARQRMNELIAKHRRELQTRLYNQDHPHPREVPPVPSINVNKIKSDNVNSTVTSSEGNQIAPIASKKGWWETWWGVVVTSVIAGLIIWGITRYLDRPEQKPVILPEVTGKQPAQDEKKQAKVLSGLRQHIESGHFVFFRTNNLNFRSNGCIGSILPNELYKIHFDSDTKSWIGIGKGGDDNICGKDVKLRNEPDFGCPNSDWMCADEMTPAKGTLILWGATLKFNDDGSVTHEGHNAGNLLMKPPNDLQNP